MTVRHTFTRDEVSEGKMYAVLSYLSILGIIPLILKKNNAFVLAHGKQGLVLFVAQVGVFIISIVFPWAFKPIVFITWILSFWGMITALRGQFTPLPMVAGIADKITL